MVKGRSFAAGGVGLALAAGGLLLLLRAWSVESPPQSPVSSFDTGFTVHLGGSPIDVAVGEEGVWVAAGAGPGGRGAIVRIDPADGDVVARIPLSEIGALTAGGGGVWVVNLRQGTVTRIDAATNEAVAVIDMPPLPYEVSKGDREFLPESIQAGSDRIWITTARGSVAFIDPATNTVTQPLNDPQTILGGVATGAEAVWVWNVFVPPEAEVWRLSQNGSGIERIRTPAVVLDAAVGRDGLYLLHVDTGDISVIEETSQSVRALGTAGERANAIAAQDSLVYVASSSGNVYAIDPVSGERRLLTHLSSEPIALAVDAGSLWVTTSDGNLTKVGLEQS